MSITESSTKSKRHMIPEARVTREVEVWSDEIVVSIHVVPIHLIFRYRGTVLTKQS